MDLFDAAAACRTAAPWDTLRLFDRINIDVGWEAIDGCAPAQFPVLRPFDNSGAGFYAFASLSDAAAFAKGGLGAVTDVVMKVSWESRRGGPPGDARVKAVVIAPGVGDDGAVGTLACPPMPNEEVWATVVLAVLPLLAREAAMASGIGPDGSSTDIWASLDTDVAVCETLPIRAGDIRATVNVTVKVTGSPKRRGGGKAAASVSTSTRKAELGALASSRGVLAVPASARSSAGTARDSSSSRAAETVSVNRIIPRTRTRKCRLCRTEVVVPASAPPEPPLVLCRCSCVYYCSLKCQTQDWQRGHDQECPVFRACSEQTGAVMSPAPFPFIEDVTALILYGATNVCEILGCWGLHGYPAFKHVPGCDCFELDRFATAITDTGPSGLRTIGTLPFSRSSLSLSLFAPCKGWADLYKLCKLPMAAPDAVAYTHAATLYHVIRMLAARNQLSVQGVDGAAEDTSAPPEELLAIDCLQPPLSVIAFPAQFKLLQLLLGNLSLHIRAVGDNIPDDMSGKILCWGGPEPLHGLRGGRKPPVPAQPGGAASSPNADMKVLTRVPKRVNPGTLLVSFHKEDDITSFLSSALDKDGALSDVLIALDANFAADAVWQPLVASLSTFVNEGVPFFATERNLFAATQAAMVLTSNECEKPYQPVLNPFRAPLCCQASPSDDALIIPSVLNGYLFGFGVEPLADDSEPVEEDIDAALGSDDDDDEALLEVDDDSDASGVDDDGGDGDDGDDDDGEGMGDELNTGDQSGINRSIGEDDEE